MSELNEHSWAAKLVAAAREYQARDEDCVAHVCGDECGTSWHRRCRASVDREYAIDELLAVAQLGNWS